MEGLYKPLEERMPDTQYTARLRTILLHGEMANKTPQGIGAKTCFGTLAPMVFELSNGAPFITERSCVGFWKQAVAEIIAFVNGARTIDEIESYGCKFWKDYRDDPVKREQTKAMGLEPGDMGPGSYGPAFHDFEKPDGTTLNQFAQLIEQIRLYPSMRTHVITPWKPYYTARGLNRKVIVAPCHGWLHFRILNGRIDLVMWQRSADMPVGVPSNMIQYAALLLMVAQVTGYRPGKYIHMLSDAHIYENQFEKSFELIDRDPRRFPTLWLDPSVKDLFAFRVEHFTLKEYDPHPGMKIHYTA